MSTRFKTVKSKIALTFVSIPLAFLVSTASAVANPLTEAPKKCVGVLVGAFVGMPIAAVRMSLREEKYAVKNIDNGCNEPRVTIPTQIFWAPFATAAGVFQAPWVAIGNSYLNYNRPFSKAQFSIVDTPEEKPGTTYEPSSVRTPGEAEGRR